MLITDSQCPRKHKEYGIPWQQPSNSAMVFFDENSSQIVSPVCAIAIFKSSWVTSIFKWNICASLDVPCCLSCSSGEARAWRYAA